MIRTIKRFQFFVLYSYLAVVYCFVCDYESFNSLYCIRGGGVWGSGLKLEVPFNSLYCIPHLVGLATEFYRKLKLSILCIVFPIKLKPLDKIVDKSFNSLYCIQEN